MTDTTPPAATALTGAQASGETSSSEGARVAVSGDPLHLPMVGLRRYFAEILAETPGRVDIIPEPMPKRRIRGWRLFWEQCLLPNQLHGRLLWSPANTGPIAVRRQVLTVHDVAFIDHPEWISRSLLAWFRLLIPPLIRRVRHVITPSVFTRDRLISTLGTDPGKITVIPHGVNRRFQPCTQEALASVRERHGIASEYVFVLGTLDPRKNLPRLFAAWEGVQERIPGQAELIVAGLPHNPRIFGDNGIRRIPPRTRLLGYVPDEDLPALYSGALIVAYPSLYEGWGAPPIEAAACGAPVLTSNCTAMPEVLGAAALTVDPYSTQSIAAALLSALTSDQLREELRARSLARAAEFSWSAAATATWELLHRFAD